MRLCDWNECEPRRITPSGRGEINKKSTRSDKRCGIVTWLDVLCVWVCVCVTLTLYIYHEVYFYLVTHVITTTRSLTVIFCERHGIGVPDSSTHPLFFLVCWKPDHIYIQRTNRKKIELGHKCHQRGELFIVHTCPRSSTSLQHSWLHHPPTPPPLPPPTPFCFITFNWPSIGGIPNLPR